MLLAFTSMLVGVSMAGTIGPEIQAIRDDLIHLCYKAYGGTSGAAKNCRRNSDIAKSPSNNHVTFKCWKSGWSGRGNLSCRYGAEAFDGLNNLAFPGDHAVHPGTEDSARRRMVGVDGEEEEDVFSDATEETEESKWENQRHPITFELENIEDENEVQNLGDVAVCFLQGVEYIQPDDEKVQSKCAVSKSADGLWQLSYTSAKCNVLCYPHGASRMF